MLASTATSSESTVTYVGLTPFFRPDVDKTASKVRVLFIYFERSSLLKKIPHMLFSTHSKCADVEREERQINYYKNKLEAAETKMRDYERCFNEAEGPDLIKKLIDEKESQTMKVFQLAERLKMMEEREQRHNSELQEAKDQAELLEFRVLELEESQEKVRSLPPQSYSCVMSYYSLQILFIKHLPMIFSSSSQSGQYSLLVRKMSRIQ